MHLKRWPSVDDNTIHPVDYAYGLWFVVFLQLYASQFIKIFNPVTTQRANIMIVPMPENKFNRSHETIRDPPEYKDSVLPV